MRSVVTHRRTRAARLALCAATCAALATASRAADVDPAPAPAAPAAAAPVPAAAAAADDAPELMLFKDIPVVVTAAGKREQTQRQVAASVSVLSADDIELFGYRSLADALRDQRSFYLHTDGLNWFDGVRGFLRPGEWNARTLVLVDGRPTRENIYGQSHLDLDFVVPIEAVKRIEIVRGPGSALYGTGAVFGVVNLVTKDGADLNGLDVKLTGGTQETARAEALFGTKTRDGWDLIGGFTAYTSQGDRDILYDGIHDAAHNFGHVRNGDYEGVDSGFLKLRKGDFTLEGDFASRNRDNRSATYLASFNDPGSEHEDRANVTARLDHEVGDGQSVHAMVYYGHYNYRQSWVYPADSLAPTPAYRYVTTGQDDWVGQEFHYDWQASRSVHLLAGADATEALFTRQADHDAIHGNVLDIPASYNQWGLFAEGEWKATDWLSVTGGLRFDEVQRVGSNLSPRLAAILTPTKQDAVKLMYGRAFRAPNLYEMLYRAPGYNDPNPNLRPELISTYEAAWEHATAGGWHTSLGAFYWQMSDAMTNRVLPDGSLMTVNDGKLAAHGVEAEAQKQWDDGARARVYATYTRATDSAGQLSHSPSYIVGGAAAVPLFNKRTFLAIEPQIVGPMSNDLGERTQATFITNVVFTAREVFPGWTFQAGAYNLFSRGARLPRDGAFNQVQHTLNYPDPQFLISLTHRF